MSAPSTATGDVQVAEAPASATGGSPFVAALEHLVAGEQRRVAPADVQALAEAVRARHGDAVLGVLYYGSLQRARDHEGVHDFYVVVDGYHRAYRGRPDRRDRPRGLARTLVLSLANRTLPPNVFYFEMPHDGAVLRTKYGVISIRDFERATRPGYRHTMIWARFAQPFVLLAARDEAARRAIARCAAEAVVTLVQRIVPLLPAVRRRRSFHAGELWTRAFRETYRAELRTETADRAVRIYEAARARYDRASIEALRELERRGRLGVRLDGPRLRVAMRPWARWRGRVAWVVRRPIGKALAIANLLKTSTTFGDWLPYVLWKIRRHTGVAIVPTPRQRRHPLIFGWPVIVRLLIGRELH